jgi:hypothetical protein
VAVPALLVLVVLVLGRVLVPAAAASSVPPRKEQALSASPPARRTGRARRVVRAVMTIMLPRATMLLTCTDVTIGERRVTVR